MFLNNYSLRRKRLFALPQPLYVVVHRADKNGYITLETLDINEAVTPTQQQSVPTDLDLCKKLGLNLEQVNISLDPTDKASIERNVEKLTSQLDDTTFNNIFNNLNSDENES